MNYSTFFDQATGNRPFPYQARLAEAGIPDLLTIPTGCGKTAAVVLSWMWSRAGHAPWSAARRLVYCLPTRALVDQTVRAASEWVGRLGLDASVSVHALLGGAVDQRWESFPERSVLLIGTQDQLLSRALNRGYAMSKYRWPIHFAWLHNDAQWVFDETQLMGVGLSTATQLQAFRDALGTAAPTASLFMSATNAPGRLETIDFRGRDLSVVGLDDADSSHPVVHRRLSASKPIAQVELDSKDTKAIAAWLLERHAAGTRTLAVFNTVRRAQDVFRAVRKLKTAPTTTLLHSRLRPGDRRRAEAALAPDFDGILVTTQVVEAGIDLSARVLLTDLAPWPSLVQRFGRCNRRGECTPADPAHVGWIDLPEKLSSPYDAEDLAHARDTLATLSDVGLDALGSIPEMKERPALPVLRRRDLLELFDTEPDLAGQHIDVGRFIRDSDDRDVQVAWRDLDGRPGEDTPDIAREELCRVPVGELRKLLTGSSSAWRWDHVDGSWERAGRPVPGQVLLLDRGVGGYDSEVGWTGRPKDVPAQSPLPTGPPPDHDGSDRWTTGVGRFVNLSQHLSDVVAEVARLESSLEGTEVPWRLVEDAARWHDLGKVHAAFQAMLTAGVDDTSELDAAAPFAKSDGRSRRRCSRPHFRHELASALGWLAHGGDDLTAYLIAAHHGKIRLHLRPRPSEVREIDGRSVVLGVIDGEMLPSADLGGGVQVDETPMDLGLARLGGAGGPSWVERTARLVDEHGPFRLAAWEALLRIADWRGSALRADPEAVTRLEAHND